METKIKFKDGERIIKWSKSKVFLYEDMLELLPQMKNENTYFSNDEIAYILRKSFNKFDLEDIKKNI